jgi:uncharacterized protein (UPF0303 family)
MTPWFQASSDTGKASHRRTRKLIESPGKNDKIRRERSEVNLNFEDDLARIAAQERALVFDRFDPEAALDIGLRLKAIAEAKAMSVAIDIRLWDRQLFFFAMAGTTADNADWARRKSNCVRRYGRPSYALMLKHLQRGRGFGPDDNADPAELAAHGGSFPIHLATVGIIGAVTVSGAPSRDDHAFVVEALARHLGRDPAPLMLDES